MAKAETPDPEVVDEQADVEVPTDVFGDAEEAYREAENRAVLIRQAWEDEKRPLLTTGSMGQQVEHPLVKMMRDAEAHAAKLRDALSKKHRGPDPKAVVSARIGKSPAARGRAQLKAVK